MDLPSPGLCLTPRGHLALFYDAGAAGLDAGLMPPVHAFWREFGAPQREVHVESPPEDELERVVLAATAEGARKAEVIRNQDSAVRI